MTDEEHAVVAKVNHHFCGLHLVVNLAEQCNAVLSEWEKPACLLNRTLNKVQRHCQGALNAASLALYVCCQLPVSLFKSMAVSSLAAWMSSQHSVIQKALRPFHWRHTAALALIGRFCSTHNTYENYVRFLRTTNVKIGFACAFGPTYVVTFVFSPFLPSTWPHAGTDARRLRLPARAAGRR